MDEPNLSIFDGHNHNYQSELSTTSEITAIFNFVKMKQLGKWAAAEPVFPKKLDGQNPKGKHEQPATSEITFSEIHDGG